jgi:ABC-type dipeptide/oligopeptide/nickel transport system permease component
VSAAYIQRRLLQSIFVLWLAATLTFLAFYFTPGDPAQVLLAASGASASEVAQRRAELGLDAGLPEQYINYLLALVQGDLGQSWLHGRSVARMILEQLPPTVELTLAAMTVGVIMGFALGILAAIRQGTWGDTAVTSLAVIGLSTPTYWTGLLAILLFSLHLGWLPATGNGGFQHLVLPAATLGFALSGSIARLVRASVVEVMSQQYVLAAHARGITPRLVLFGHVLRPAIAPTITLIALQFGFLLGGAVITESVFARQGLGKLAVEAILWRDLPVIRGVVILGAIVYVSVNLLADLAQVWLNPRLRDELA